LYGQRHTYTFSVDLNISLLNTANPFGTCHVLHSKEMADVKSETVDL